MDETQSLQEIQLVAFSLADEEYGVDIHYVQEIVRLLTITRVPKAPGYVEGVVNLRGNVVPVIDLRKLFSLPMRDVTDRTRIIIVKIKDITVGIIVDGVSEVLTVPVNDIEPPPMANNNIDQEFISGVGKLGQRLLMLINLDKVILNLTQQ
ncbi:chemotaxis protein CheW [Heliophilum fasciatum]|uniref:CheW protein n=1 Tax=Heliophilum fasciatum TaxID=35700 RepID=A0A4R2RKT6_9FIRM|nr:chemotaxis protein CheW [Heliophilum fasciatum]MCW2277920.1 purine-binding chemotaxis protein CheW [Heliophilum fasciatum]TCP64510.1 CheW protein [Heliophilum fasciatum]